MRQPTDWGQPCPNSDCAHERLMTRGPGSAISPSLTQRGQRRICLCRKCTRPFSASRAPVFVDLKTPQEQSIMALPMLLVNVALSALGCVLGVTEATVLAWLRRAAPQADELNAHRLREWPVTQGPLDAMGHCITRQHAPQAGPDGASTALREDGRPWVWSSFAPECRLLLAAFVGPRTFARAGPLMPLTAAVVVGGPCFVSAGCRGDRAALSEVSQTLTTLPRTGQPGRPQPPLKEPHAAVV